MLVLGVVLDVVQFIAGGSMTRLRRVEGREAIHLAGAVHVISDSVAGQSDPVDLVSTAILQVPDAQRIRVGDTVIGAVHTALDVSVIVAPSPLPPGIDDIQAVGAVGLAQVDDDVAERAVSARLKSAAVPVMSPGFR